MLLLDRRETPSTNLRRTGERRQWLWWPCCWRARPVGATAERSSWRGRLGREPTTQMEIKWGAPRSCVVGLSSLASGLSHRSAREEWEKMQQLPEAARASERATGGQRAAVVAVRAAAGLLQLAASTRPAAAIADQDPETEEEAHSDDNRPAAKAAGIGPGQPTQRFL